MNKKIKILICVFSVFVVMLLLFAKVEELAQLKAKILNRVFVDKTNTNIIVSDDPFAKDDESAWYAKENVLIAHAGGGIGGKTYISAKECLENSIKNGFEFIELDFLLTSDGCIAFRDVWIDERYETEYVSDIPTYSEYISTPICYKYTPLGLDDLLLMMEENQNLYLITDGDIEEILPVFVDYVYQKGKSELLDRVIVQIYFEDDFDKVMEIYPFKILYTLYMQREIDYNDVVDFCLKKDIHVITIPYESVTAQLIEKITSYNIHVYTHTVNSISDMKGLFELGVSGIYTDYIISDDLQYLVK